MRDGWDRLRAALQAGRLGRRDFLAAATALGISSALTDAALAQAASTPKRGGHLAVGLRSAGTGDSLDPALWNTEYTATAGQLFYDNLTIVDVKNGTVQALPALAESWSPKAGAKEWVFKLRKGVSFHNGKELTASDAVHSINHHRGKDSKSGAKAMVAPISDVKATDKYEVTFTLDSGNADLPFLLGDWHLGIGPEGSNFTDGVGTGAFVLDGFEPGVRMRGKRNPHDYRSDRGYVDTVEALAINDPAARINALLSGTAHLVSAIEPSIVAQLGKSAQTQVFTISGGAYSSFEMFNDTAPYNNPDLRLALKYAFDRSAVLRTVLHGNGKLGNDTPIPAFDPFYAADLPQRPFDPDKAKFHFKKAGVSDEIVLTVADVSFVGAVDTAQIFQSSAKRAGIPIRINRVSNDGYYATVWLKNPFCAFYSVGRPTADLLFSTFYAGSAPNNNNHWRVPKFDQLLVQARAELDPAKRKPLYHDMQTMLYEEGGSLIPTFNNFIDGAAKNIRGFVPTPVRQMSNQRAPEKVWFES